MIDFVFTRPAIRQFVTTSFVLAVIFLILFFRNPLLFIYPVPHGEDLPQFLGQEYNIGFPKTAFILYAGYIHLLPRIIAWISLKFGWSDAMLVMNWIVLSIKILAFYLIYKSKVISSWYIKFCLIAYMVLVPFADEIYNNVTNLQWWLIPLMAVVFVRHENSVLSVLFSCCVLVLTGLTGVNSIMFAIPCAYMLFMVRTKICLVKSVIIVICAIIQCYCLLSSPRMGNVAYETIYMMGGGMANKFNQSIR